MEAEKSDKKLVRRLFFNTVTAAFATAGRPRTLRLPLVLLWPWPGVIINACGPQETHRIAPAGGVTRSRGRQAGPHRSPGPGVPVPGSGLGGSRMPGKPAGRVPE